MANSIRKGVGSYFVTGILCLVWIGYGILTRSVIIPDAGRAGEFKGRIGAVSERGDILVTVDNRGVLRVYDTATRQQLTQDSYERATAGHMPIEEIDVRGKDVVFSYGEERERGDEQIMWFDCDTHERTRWARGENPFFAEGDLGIIYHSRNAHYQVISTLLPEVVATVYALSRDGKWAATSAGIYFVPTKECIAAANGLSMVSRDGKVGITLKDDTIILQDLETRQPIKEYPADEYVQNAYQFGEHNIIFAMSGNKTAFVDGTRVRVSRILNGVPTKPLAAEDADYFLTADYGKIYLWDTQSFRKRYALVHEDAERAQLSAQYFFMSHNGIADRHQRTYMYTIETAVRAYQIHKSIMIAIQLMFFVSLVMTFYVWYRALHKRYDVEETARIQRENEILQQQQHEKEIRETMLAKAVEECATVREKVECVQGALVQSGEVADPMCALYEALRRLEYCGCRLLFDNDSAPDGDAFRYARQAVAEWEFVTVKDDEGMRTASNAVIGIARTSAGACVVTGGDFSAQPEVWERMREWVEYSRRRYGITEEAFV